jgi:hypothetical protein
MALPIWALFMQRLYNDSSVEISMEDFEPPLNAIPFDTDCENIERPSRRENIFDQPIF